MSNGNVSEFLASLNHIHDADHVILGLSHQVETSFTSSSLDNSGFHRALGLP
jgi:hypothetical protein